jgi:hypothetical protein
MPCLIGCLALAFPRLMLVAVWLLSNYLGRAYETVLWPVLGFLFLPLTTLAYAFAFNSTGGAVSGGYLALVVVAVVVDLGLVGSGRRSSRRRN